MNKNTRLLIYLLLILVPAYITSYFIISSRRDLAGKLLKIKTAEITGIVVMNEANIISLAKKDKGFVFAKPFASIAADSDSVQKYFNLLSKLTVKRDLGRYNEADAQAFGITSSAPKISLDRSGGKIIFIVGRRSAIEPQNYIYDPDLHKLLLTENIVEALGNLRPEDLRERRLFKFDATGISSITLQLPGARRLAFNKRSGDWYVQDVKSGHEYLCDAQPAVSLANIVSKASISDFGPLDRPVAQSISGLKAPRAVISLTTSSAAVHLIELGNFYGKGLQYTALDGVTRGGISAQFLLQLSTPTAYYFRTTLADFQPSRIITFTSAGADVPAIYEKNRGLWYRTAKKKRLFEEEKIDGFMNTLFSLKISKFIFDEPFGNVEKEYSFFDRDGKQLMCLQIGGRSGDLIKAQFKDKRGVFGLDPAQISSLDL